MDLISNQSSDTNTKKGRGSSRRNSIKTSPEDGPEVTEEGDKHVIVNTIVQEIMKNALELIYEKYLDRQTVYFVSYCTRLAWKSLIEWDYQRKDTGVLRESPLDTEPPTSPKDSWAGHSVPIVKREHSSGLPRTDTKHTSATTPAPSELLLAESPTRDAEELKLQTTASDKLIRIMAMKRRLFPSHPARTANQTRQSSETKELHRKSRKSVDLKKESYELPTLVPLQTKYFPSSRVEVKYSIDPGTRGFVSNKTPKAKTIRLAKQRVSEEEEEDD